MKPQSDQAPWTISRLLVWTTEYFTSHNIESPRMGAELLLAHCLNLKRLDLYLQFDKPLTPAELAHYKTMIKRRVNREPVAYITGSKGFWSMELGVSRHVLIPRPDTECLIEAALKVMPESGISQPFLVLDLGVGSGAIILALASERKGNYRFYGVDISPHAVLQSKINRDANQLEDHVFFVNGSWFDPFKKNILFDVIVSNPPYIPRAHIDGLEPEVSRYEPRLALDGDEDGLKYIREILVNASNYLKEGGYLFIEIGYDQKEPVFLIAEKQGCYQHIKFIKDYAGHDRVVKLMKKSDLTN